LELLFASSLLPDYRGAAPINWVIINVKKKLEFVHFSQAYKIDTGDMIMSKKSTHYK
jgi:methionyl-tRNA formyltransferase